MEQKYYFCDVLYKTDNSISWNLARLAGDKEEVKGNKK